jgi:surface protein
MAEIINIQNINPITFEIQTYSLIDSALINSTTVGSIFNPSTDIIEYFIYDLNSNILFENVNGYPSYYINNNVITLTPEENLKDAGFTEGNYNTLYNFLTPKLGSNSLNRYFISEISSDRTEIRLDTTAIPNDVVVSSTVELFNEIINSTGSYYDFYLNFGDNQLIIANNVLLDNSIDTNSTVLIKLYDALPSQFSIKDELWVVVKVSDPVAYNISIVNTFDIEDEFIYLRGPNTNLNVRDQINNSTNYTNLANLNNTSTPQGSGSYQYQLNSLLAETGIEINIDYSDYSNFIHFSSAQTRLENFYYKLSLIEQYNYSASLSSGTPTNYYVSSSNIVYQNKINEIITGFDGYEYFLYYESGSTCWPKNNTPPYVNVLTTSVTGQNWLVSQSLVAENYDLENNNALTSAIPSYITDDPSNFQFSLFIEMIGQSFDNTFVYLQDVTNKYNADNRLNYGVSKDLVADILRDMGVKIYQNNFSSDDLYSALIGFTPSGSLYNLPYTTTQYPVPSGSFLEYITTYVTASSTSSLVPTSDINKEQYKRIYHNLPLLLKKKGSTQGLKDLITTFGVPDTILRVNEFGGKDKNPNTWDYWQNEYNYTFSTSGSGFVSAPWDGSEFISLWRTSNTSAGSSTSTQVRLPLVSTGTYNMLVDWGDGTTDTITTWNQAQTTHTYANAGDYTITIKGVCRGFQFNNGGDRLKLLNISQYGILNLSTDSAFWGCTNFNQTATDVPTISTNSFVFMFAGCTNFNGNVGNWNTSGVVRMDLTFAGASSFNNGGSPLINNWNTSNVTNMSAMFNGALLFNQPIGNWNTSNVTNMIEMFKSTSNFNQNIGGWNVSKVTGFGSGASDTGMFNFATAFNNGGSPDINNWILSSTNNITMDQMFRGATSFNQPIGNWNTLRVISMGNMFFGAINFDQDLSNWNTSGVIDMSVMFTGASKFNNGGSPLINNWNTSNVVGMQFMFSGASLFNQPVGNWNTSNVTNMQFMFNGTPFNQDISLWNTGNVTNMSGMFRLNSNFNQNISGWNVSKVTAFSTGGSDTGMFNFATAFNQNLGAWNLRLAGVFLQEIFRSSGMSCQNYTDTIVSWANKVQTNSNTPINVNMASQSGRRFDGTRSGGAGFASASAARTYLTTATPTGAGWTINGDTLGAC